MNSILKITIIVILTIVSYSGYAIIEQFFYKEKVVKSPLSTNSLSNNSAVSTDFLLNNISAEKIYDSIKFNDVVKPSVLCFSQAFNAYKLLMKNDLVKNEILTVIDFSLASSEKRLWIIDMKNHVVLLNTLVAHGIKSGDEFASRFSNHENSFQSSLGVYLTGEVYTGRNGLSLRLDGLNEGYNNLARKRGVVIHGADYVSTDYIETNGRLGRSQGCPAVATEINEKLIDTIKDKSVLFIYHPDIKSIAFNELLNLQGIIKRDI